MRYSLRTLLIAFTVACLLCGGLVASDVLIIRHLRNRWLTVHVGSLSAGMVDWPDDENGTVVGIWWNRVIDDGGLGMETKASPLVEIEIGESMKLASR